MAAGDPVELALAGPDYYQDAVPVSNAGGVNLTFVKGQTGYLVQIHAISWDVTLNTGDTTERIVKYEFLDATGNHFAWFSAAANLFAGGAPVPPVVSNLDVMSEAQGFVVTNPQTNDNVLYAQQTARFPPLPSGWSVKMNTIGFNATDRMSAIRLLLQRVKVARNAPDQQGEPPGSSVKALAFLLHTP